MVRNSRRIMALSAVVLIVLQLALVLASWFIAAAWPDVQVRSMLSAEGIRWFFGTFARNVSSPLLLWIVLAAAAYGAMSRSGLSATLRQVLSGKRLMFGQRFGLWVALVELLLFIVVMLLLVCLPHALLLSIQGTLFPSSFSASLVPYACFSLTVAGLSFGLASRRLQKVEQCFGAVVEGIAASAPIILLYILLSQFCHSLFFVF